MLLFFLAQFICINFITNCSNVPVAEVSRENRETMLFEHIVKNTNKVAIGPLEYCGNGRVIRTTHNKKLYVFFFHSINKLTYKQFLMIRVSVIRGEKRQDLLSRQSSKASLQSIASTSEDRNSDFSDYQSDSDAISEVPQASSSSRLPRHRFCQISMDKAPPTHFSNEDSLPHDLEPTSLSDLESEPFPPTSEFESGTALSSDFETHLSDDENPALESVYDSEAKPVHKRQKRTHLTHDRLLTQIGLQLQQGNQGNLSRPSRTQAAPKNYAHKKRSYTKRK
jgi:hypothetical protein